MRNDLADEQLRGRLAEAVLALRHRVSYRRARNQLLSGNEAEQRPGLFNIQDNVIAEAQWALDGFNGPNPSRLHQRVLSSSLLSTLYSVLCELSFNFPGASKDSDKIAAAYLGWEPHTFAHYRSAGRSRFAAEQPQLKLPIPGAAS